VLKNQIVECYSCTEDAIEDLIVNCETYCEDCYKDLTPCVSCDEKIETGCEVETEQCDTYCEDCASEETFTCDQCAAVNDSSQDPIEFDCEIYCEDCASEHLVICAHCDEYADQDHSHVIGYGGYESRYVCEDCRCDLYSYCESCEELVDNDNMRFTDYDSQCIDCAGENGNGKIKRYGYKPSCGLKFYRVNNTGTDKNFLSDTFPIEETFFGLEIEIEFQSEEEKMNHVENLSNYAENIYSNPDRLVTFTEDSTINRLTGVETVFQPHTRNALNKRLKMLVNGSHGHFDTDLYSERKNAGIHISVNIDAFESDLHVRTFGVFFHNLLEADLLSANTGRSSTGWCSTIPNQNIDNYIRRRDCVNIMRDRVEVRAYIGTLDTAKIMSFVDDLQSIIDFTRLLSLCGFEYFIQESSPKHVYEAWNMYKSEQLTFSEVIRQCTDLLNKKFKTHTCFKAGSRRVDDKISQAIFLLSK